jgi:crotonobetaine/carnitine-CoA ligase
VIDTDILAERVFEDQCVGELLRRRASELGARTFLTWRSESWSFAMIDEMANQVASSLHALGVGHGDRVALMLGNSPEWVGVWFGVVRIGAVLVSINTAYKGPGLRYQLADAEPTVLVIGGDLAGRLDSLEPVVSIDHIFVSAGYSGPTPARPLEELFQKGGDGLLPEVKVAPCDPACILYTSGTTGPPKGCLLPHGQYLAAAHLHADACQYDESSTIYSCLPLFHINAQNYVVLSALAAGATVALDDKFSASQFWQKLIDSKATAFNIIGSMTAALWSREPSEVERRHGATVAYGVPLATETWEAWEQRFGVRVVYAYGMTENALPNIIDARDTPVPGHLRGAAGRASPTTEVSIVNDDDRPVAAGVVGQILTRPKIPWTMMLEYVNKPTATIEAFRGCWFHTGDLGYVDEDGYLFYVDRSKDAVRRRGEMVSSWAVEGVVGRYPGVSDCAMVGVPSPMGEEDVLIVLVYEGEFDPLAFGQFCNDRLAFFQVPRYVRIMAELPRTQTQRVEKYRLRQEGVTVDTYDLSPRL